MPSMRTSNGYPRPIGQLSDPSNPSRKGTQGPTSLGFLTSHYVSEPRKDHHLGRHDRWDKGRQHQREILWQYLAAKKKQEQRQQSSTAALLAMLLIATALMVSVILDNEAIPLRIESNLEQVR